jgi:ATP-dependent exoDNAse (exonuclease V) beta subunit
VAVWDGRFGCVTRPPADEEPPPFADFGWRLWKAHEDMADYHEDLRTLYVASTRAADYLVLSGSLAEPVRPVNTWMLTLVERFDLASGVCKDDAIPPERRPQVRVTVAESLASSAPRASRPRIAAEWRTEDEAQIAAVLPQLTERDVVPLSAIEECLQASWGRKPPVEGAQRVTAPLTGGVRPPLAGLARQFAAEDDADRSDWLHPCERVRGVVLSPQERRLREVLERWDFHDPEGWRAELAGNVDAELRAMLGRFAASDLCRQLGAARTCRRDVEFVLDLVTDDTATLPHIWGLIDVLWQDDAGDWHLLAWTTAPLEETWSRRRPGLILQAWAVQQQLAAWPKVVALYSFAEDRSIRCPYERFGHRALITQVQIVLSDLLQQPLPPE